VTYTGANIEDYVIARLSKDDVMSCIGNILPLRDRRIYSGKG